MSPILIMAALRHYHTCGTWYHCVNMAYTDSLYRQHNRASWREPDDVSQLRCRRFGHVLVSHILEVWVTGGLVAHVNQRHRPAARNRASARISPSSRAAIDSPLTATDYVDSDMHAA